MKWSLNLARRTDESICAAHIVDEDGIAVAQLALHDEETVLRNAGIICSASQDPFFDMLWDWFEDESRIGAEGMRPERREGLSVDDFKQMLDEHEAALLSHPQS